MARKQDKNILVGLDIGTSKVTAIVGEMSPDGEIEIIGVGSRISTGLKRGVVVNIELTVQSIQRAIEEAELMAGCDITSVVAGVAGSHIQSLNSHGVAAVKENEITRNEVEKVIESARAMAIPAEHKILHVLPQEYVIDGQAGVKVPEGMSGIRLEAKVHIITGALSAVENIIRCVTRCGLEVENVVLEQLASSHSVLTEDEKELGVCLVDIGGGTTDIAVFTDGALHHTSVIPIAGDQVTNDIAVAFRTPTKDAEDIKIQYACSSAQLVNSDETIEVPSVGDRPPRKLSRQRLADIVQPRYEELLTFVLKELRRSGYEDRIPAGVVLTGGSSNMEGLADLAEEIFHLQVRVGSPQYVSGLVDIVKNPIHATGVGLLLFSRDDNKSLTLNANGGSMQLNSIWESMKSWFQQNL
ncbi:MAG: cell division protein FtsA [Pseudomonadota bacterium]